MTSEDGTVSGERRTSATGPWLLGERFSAADVALGAVLSVALFNERIPPRPRLVEYNARISSHRAYITAANATWPR